MLLITDPSAAIISYSFYWALYGWQSRCRRGKERWVSADICLLVYSIQTIAVGLQCLFYNRNELLTRAAIGYNYNMPLVELTMNLSIGFVLYNLHHSLSWYRKHLLHDIILLSSYVLSDLLGFYGLALVMSAVLSALGSTAYLFYIRKATTRGHLEYLICFGLSRLLLLLWSAFVIHECFSPPKGDWKSISAWCPPFVLIIQLLVLWAEVDAWRRQCNKFRRAQWKRYRATVREMQRRMRETPLKTRVMVTIKFPVESPSLKSASPRHVRRRRL
ncbi:hypothetical protein FOL47_007556 [Perkinsus chesapeaki]|uniref:Uncharacterized protein n=1 Tax=Perkinsus chesapeaki TaxID=330153 RepID=A0A7J6MVR7_PERCH|nr:hypothetical protein FOL47_007556 [Perkinsus chesapeaki]